MPTQDLLDVPALLIRFTSHWDRGVYVAPDGTEIGSFESTAEGRASLWRAELSDTEGRLALRVQERRADPIHNHHNLDGKRTRHSYGVTDAVGESVGLIWSRPGALGGNWLLHLQTADHSYELRAQHLVADWNPDNEFQELAFDLAGEATATVTARWSEAGAPTDNISVHLPGGLDRRLRGLLAITPLCLPRMGLTGARSPGTLRQ